MGFLRNTHSGGQSLTDRRIFKVLMAGLIPLVILVLLAIFVPSLTQSILVAPISIILLLLTIGLLANAFPTTRTPDATEKRKREVENLDMYSMIDRLVDDLDEDELAHLRRRLEEREQGHDTQLTQSLEALLDKRSEARQNQSQQ